MEIQYVLAAMLSTFARSNKGWTRSKLVLILSIIAVGTVAQQPARAQATLKVLYTFKGAPDAANPNSGVVRDGMGNFYGTTYLGGDDAESCTPLGCGAVYKLNITGKETVLHSFTGRSDGENPVAGLLRDSAGNIYGTTVNGGLGGGTVFKLDSTGQETVLYDFVGEASPVGGVIRDGAGNLYGTTYYGGTYGFGTVYKLDTFGVETVLYSFGGYVRQDGAFPNAALVRDTAGNLYGTTVFGGTSANCAHSGCGTVFKLDKLGRETMLYSFAGGADGRNPYSGLVRDASGNLYGTTYSGGVATACCGTVYKVDTTGKEVAIYTFAGGMDATQTLGTLILDAAGNLYGTSAAGGDFGHGTAFMVDATGKETVLHSFTGGTDGEIPYGSLIRDSVGNLYGTTYQGAAFNSGTVFELTFP
jgi:uncharacterized repeat protein (TIGR03803 family)